MRKPIHVLAGAALLGAVLLLPRAGAAESARSVDLGAVNGGSCPVTADESEARAQKMARLEAQLRAEMARAEADGDVKVLNGRGYRYEDDRVPGIAHELSILELELQRARAAAKAQQQVPAQ